MEQDKTQMNMEDLTSDEAAASLAFATHLSEGMMMANNPENIASETSQNAPGQEQMPGMGESMSFDPEALKNEIFGEVEKVIEDKIGELKDMLAEALSDEDEPEKKSKTKELAK